MPTTTHLICPKCQGEMRSYERNRILVDQCQECRGVFLDRGELERLLDAESGPRRNDRDNDSREERHWKRHHDDRHRERRRRSFFEDLLGD
jgi:Zn-finger nucleic acid-binding protein